LIEKRPSLLLFTDLTAQEKPLPLLWPVIPIGAGLLALTPISPFRPRRWRGALLPRTASILIEVLDAAERRVSATADFTEIRHVARVTVREDQSLAATLLFDPEHGLEERIIREQFQP